MRERIESLIYRDYFPFITSLGKSGLALLTQGQGNLNLLGYYLIGSVLWDSGELWFNQNPQSNFSCAERHLAYDIPRFLMENIQDAASDLSMTISDWADRRRGR